VLLGVPVALAGALYYLVLLLLAVSAMEEGTQRLLRRAALLTPLGFLASLWFVFVQAVLLRAFCLYCLFSAAISTTLFGLSIALWRNPRAPKREAAPPRGRPRPATPDRGLGF
jgi:uncharacterized membrane protein